MPVRGLNDLRNENQNQMQRGAMPSYNQQARRDRMQGANVIMVGGDDNGDGGVFPSMSKTLAPNFSKNTFIFWITCIQIFMFVVELGWAQYRYGTMFSEDNTMAGPDCRPLKDLGAKTTWGIQQGQIYRLVTPAILHGGILHIFMNLFFQTMLCYTYEKKWGTGRMAYFYFLTAIGASVMSATTSTSSVSVGASGSLFGMLGVQMAYLIMNWNDNPYAALQQQAQQQGAQVQGQMGAPAPNQAEMCQLVCIILMNFMFSASDSSGANIDNWAHAGGLISGFLLGFPFVAKADAPPSFCSNVQNVKLFFLLASLIYFGVLLGMIFFSLDNTYDICTSAQGLRL